MRFSLNSYFLNQFIHPIEVKINFFLIFIKPRSEKLLINKKKHSMFNNL
jgi:hypothetical protein